MNEGLQIFVGLPHALEPFLAFGPSAHLYRLTLTDDLVVLPFDEPLQDNLHRRFGSGDWLESHGAMLSTTDMAFAAECSALAPIAYLEAHDDADATSQSAAVWQHGHLTIGPTTLHLSGIGARRPRSLWPVNVALRTLCVSATATGSEYVTFGLDRFSTNALIRANARPV